MLDYFLFQENQYYKVNLHEDRAEVYQNNFTYFINTELLKRTEILPTKIGRITYPNSRKPTRVHISGVNMVFKDGLVMPFYTVGQSERQAVKEAKKFEERLWQQKWQGVRYVGEHRHKATPVIYHLRNFPVINECEAFRREGDRILVKVTPLREEFAYAYPDRMAVVLVYEPYQTQYLHDGIKVVTLPSEMWWRGAEFYHSDGKNFSFVWLVADKDDENTAYEYEIIDLMRYISAEIFNRRLWQD